MLQHYNTCLGNSLRNKQSVQIEEAFAEHLSDTSICWTAEFFEPCPDRTLHYELHKIPHIDKVDLAKRCFQNSELLRKFAWAIVRQNKQKAVEVMSEFTQHLAEWSEIAEKELKTDGQYLQVQNELGRSYKTIAKTLDQCNRANYWDFRHSGKKIYKFVE